jgi:broad specificity phosphatase PhoE
MVYRHPGCLAYREFVMRICLVRHTTPLVDAAQPAEAWGVGDEGRAQAAELVPSLAEAGATVIVTSPELKARITAEIIAEGLGIPLREDERLREQGLGAVPFYGDHDAFHARVQEHFAHPDLKVLGQETSRQAGARFQQVVRELGAGEVPILVSHGRIISAWLASQVALDAHEIWQNLRMPDAIQVDIDEGLPR